MKKYKAEKVAGMSPDTKATENGERRRSAINVKV